ncbi:hypothetical protein FQA47_022133 [Oryzias melastigma]|uniref:Uncharacterized protein n=1 Tax=Oryzias melastigma TaxID=30732 RepID=A0A834FN53_ORYME|nr:hypothetical protein FQA47_022133 [Oryzias melastigma]
MSPELGWRNTCVQLLLVYIQGPSWAAATHLSRRVDAALKRLLIMGDVDGGDPRRFTSGVSAEVHPAFTHLGPVFSGDQQRLTSLARRSAAFHQRRFGGGPHGVHPPRPGVQRRSTALNQSRPAFSGVSPAAFRRRSTRRSPTSARCSAEISSV